MTVELDMNITPVLGSDLDDNLTSGSRAEVLSGADGDDTIYAGGGRDEVFGGLGNDLLYGEAGDDIIYGNGNPAYVDMSNLVVQQQTTATATFMNETAGHQSAIGVYEISSTGAIVNTQILFANASASGSGGDLIGGDTSVTFNVSAGVQLGFFFLPNGYGQGVDNQAALTGTNGTYEMRSANGDPATINSGPVELYYIENSTGQETHLQTQYGNDIYHSAAREDDGYALNPGGHSQIVGRASTVTGSILIGFEDRNNGGDRDFDDVTINVELGQANVVALSPPSSGTSSSDVPDDDVIYGGAGNDTMFGISGDDELHGGLGNDELSGNSGADILNGDEGDDILTGNSGDDILNGGTGVDTLNGNSGDDELSGGDGEDTLFGGSGDDILNGDADADTLNGGSGIDLLFGGDGEDILNGNSGNDTVHGGNDDDTLNGHSGDDILFGDDGCDKLVGGGGNDQLSGGADNDKLYGGSGNDALEGGDGQDYLTAGSGDDTIEGGLGDDKMRGGSGADTFVFDFSEENLGSDRIYDFELTDMISLLNSSYESFAQISSNLSQVGDDVYANFEGECSITIHDTDLATMVEGHFLFG